MNKHFRELDHNLKDILMKLNRGIEIPEKEILLLKQKVRKMKKLLRRNNI